MQIGAFSTEAAAERAYAEVAASFPQFASGRTRGIQRVTTSDGWAMTVPQVDTDLSADRMLGTGGLTGFAPLGRLDANQMEVTRSPNGDYLLNLTGDVRLVYQP